MQAGHYASLLPDVFKHKTSRVRVYKPQVVLLDFHGTISERRWEDKVIIPYVKKTIGSFIKTNWSSDTIQRCLVVLRSESFEQRFRYKNDDVPIIDDELPDVDDDEQARKMAEQMSDFVAWQLSAKRETKETQILERLVWQDGFKRKQILTPLYDDVMPCIKHWHDHYSCAIHIISSLDTETLQLLLENTDKGNLATYISGYVSAKKSGDKILSETYRLFSEKVGIKSSSLKSDDTKSRSRSLKATNGMAKSPSTLSSQKTPSSGSLKSVKSGAVTSQVSETNMIRPILFLTDSGQEAKAAFQATDVSVYECLLVNRPGNKRFRSYYLSQFQFVEKFDDIEFVQQ